MEILNKIQKELHAPKNQNNTFGKYKYRSCEDILEAVKPMLGGATLTITDDIVHFPSHEPIIKILKDRNGNEKTEVISGDRFYIKATATITDGEDKVSVSAYAREEDNKKGMDSSQITGSASSYARKYALNGLFCIDDTKDDDHTNDGKKEAKPAPKKTPAPKKESTSNFKFLENMKDLKIKLGEPTYYKILDKYGYKKSNLVNDRNDQVTIYREMVMIVEQIETDSN
jgi:hypothetical protein